MNNFLRLSDEKTKKQGRSGKIPLHPHITPERIEKLKKTFQPFWMRGMIPHKKVADETLNRRNNFSHI
ncbi:MAG: hypothetical protein AMJ91_05440 [candidate division Zixibacteria bacterium SM23_73_3]|nr:MAG: hypothetical protein AMJ91_05440 [candidate division Zixibacteria bacterium SM23_73_3]